jgi:hypothetical protein
LTPAAARQSANELAFCGRATLQCSTPFEPELSRSWIREGHIRFLTPLAFLSPRIGAAIVNGDVPAGATVSGLVRPLPYNWPEQEQRFGLR